VKNVWFGWSGGGYRLRLQGCVACGLSSAVVELDLLNVRYQGPRQVDPHHLETHAHTPLSSPVINPSVYYFIIQ